MQNAENISDGLVYTNPKPQWSANVPPGTQAYYYPECLRYFDTKPALDSLGTNGFYYADAPVQAPGTYSDKDGPDIETALTTVT